MHPITTFKFVFQYVFIGLGIALLVLLLGGRGQSWFNGSDEAHGFAAAVQAAAPAVVSIHTATAVAASENPLTRDPLFKQFFNLPNAPRKRQLETSLGSGVIIDKAGHILTNYHVVRAADRIEVVLADGRVAEAAVVGSDPDTDLAVLRAALDDPPTIRLGDSNRVRVGDIVLAIGNPVGVGQTVTQGIISATGRNRIGINTFENFIQTDAAINPGNSGGALITAQGDMIGVNAAILGYQGIGFAIPTSIAVNVMRQLIATGSVERGWIGVDARDLSPSLKAELNSTAEFGIAVLAVMLGGPADRAGIQPGDVITHIGGEVVRNSTAAIERIADLKPRARVRIALDRFGTPLQFNTIVGKRPGAPTP